MGIGQAVFDQTTAVGGLYVHVAVNGSPLAPALDAGGGDWGAGGELRSSLMSQIAAMVDPASPTYVPGAYLQKIVWVQGEADTWLTSAATNYARDLKSMHAAMTARFGSYDLVISALSDAAINGKPTSDNHRANWANVQCAQLALAAADDSIHLIDPDVIAAKGGYTAQSMLMWDKLHYNSANGYAEALGRALVQAGEMTAQAAPALGTATGPHYATGSGGNDVLQIAATGLGQAYGSAGFDTLTLTSRAEGVKIAGGGLDALRITANGGPAFYLDIVSIESLVLTNGADKVVMAAGLTRVTSGGGNDWINGLVNNDVIYLGTGNDMGHGGSGNDSLFAGDGNDLLFGSDGNDVLSGDSGSDRLYGGAGFDRLTGGFGSDLLSGGTGRDTFVFGTGSGTDTIIDFENGIDRIQMIGTSRDLSITAAGTDTIVKCGDVTLVIEDMAASLITAADFIFT